MMIITGMNNETYIIASINKTEGVQDDFKKGDYMIVGEKTIYTSYYAKLKSFKGERKNIISVSRYVPKGLNKEDLFAWIPELAPSPQLLRSYKDGLITIDELLYRYNLSLKELYVTDCVVKRSIDGICDLLRGDDEVVLLCYEKSVEGVENCHRKTLAQFIKSKITDCVVNIKEI